MGQHRLLDEEHTLYPKLRLGIDLYQSLGLGFELSLGMRRLQFDDAVNIFVGSLTKYWGSWMFTARSYVTPGDGGVSVSGHGIIRWYFGGEGTNYLGLRYAHGLSREIRSTGDATMLGSNTLALDATAWLTHRFEVFAQGIVSQSERLRDTVRQYSTSAGVGWRF
jgi:YaiO family outer membrane protein